MDARLLWRCVGDLLHLGIRMLLVMQFLVVHVVFENSFLIFVASDVALHCARFFKTCVSL